MTIWSSLESFENLEGSTCEIFDLQEIVEKEDGMYVVKCLNCNNELYGEQHGVYQILKRDDKIVLDRKEDIKNSPHYNEIVNLIILPPPPRQPINQDSYMTCQLDDLPPQLSLKLNDYCDRLKNEMNERIQAFIESEEKIFSNQISQAQQTIYSIADKIAQKKNLMNDSIKIDQVKETNISINPPPPTTQHEATPITNESELNEQFSSTIEGYTMIDKDTITNEVSTTDIEIIDIQRDVIINDALENNNPQEGGGGKFIELLATSLPISIPKMVMYSREEKALPSPVLSFYPTGK